MVGEVTHEAERDVVDFERIDGTKLPLFLRITGALTPWLEPLLRRTGLLSRLPGREITWMQSASKLLSEGQPEEAYAFAREHLRLLRREERRTGFVAEVAYWRLLVPFAEAVAASKDVQKCHELIAEADLAPWSWRGYFPAAAAEHVSRACHGCGERSEAVRFSDLCVRADPTWPGGWVWSSWLKLSSGAPDAEAFVMRAFFAHPKVAPAILASRSFAGFAIVEKLRATPEATRVRMEILDVVEACLAHGRPWERIRCLAAFDEVDGELAAIVHQLFHYMDDEDLRTKERDYDELWRGKLENFRAKLQVS